MDGVETELDRLEREADERGMTVEQHLSFLRLEKENNFLKQREKAARNKTLFKIGVVIVVMFLYLLLFKPYVRYDKVVYNGGSYMTRTNIITGKTEVLQGVRWISEKDLDED